MLRFYCGRIFQTCINMVYIENLDQLWRFDNYESKTEGWGEDINSRT